MNKYILVVQEMYLDLYHCCPTVSSTTYLSSLSDGISTSELLSFTSSPSYPPPHSDGMSRTGVFITTMAEVERVKVQGEVDFFQTVKAARSERPHMVSTPASRGQAQVGYGWGGGVSWGWGSDHTILSTVNSGLLFMTR